MSKTLHDSETAANASYEWIAENEIEKIYTANRRGDNPEIQAIRKGFEKLRN